MDNEADSKIVTLYEIDLYSVVSWDEENDSPKDMDPIVIYDEQVFPIVFTELAPAYEYFKKNEEDFSANGISIDLSAIEIRVPNGEANRFSNVERLDEEDYASYLPEAGLRVIAWDYVCGRFWEVGNDSEYLEKKLA